MKHHLLAFLLNFCIFASIAVFTAVQVTDLLLPQESRLRRITKSVAAAGGVSFGVVAATFFSPSGDDGVVEELFYIGNVALATTGIFGVWYGIAIIIGWMRMRNSLRDTKK